MDDSTNTSPGNGDRNMTMTGSQSGEQPPPNETMNRTVERTCTQKLTIPTLEKQDCTSANMWWRKFVQYIEMTKDLDLSRMTNSKEILPQYRDQLEAEIKDIFLWAIGQNAITEMTKTVREREPSSLPLHKLYSLFRLHFTPERNVHHSRADFFELKREEGESAADVWKRILAIERNCEFETITAAELLASKFLSVIGKSTGDYDLKKKIRKSDMSVEAITEALHEHMYEKLHDSPETEEEKKIRYLNKRKAKSHKKQTDKPTKLKKMDCNRCGAPNWSRQHECPARGKKCAKCEKIGHYAKCCRTNKKINRIQEHETSSAEEDDWSPNTIHCINQKIHSTRQVNKDGPDFFTLTACLPCKMSGKNIKPNIPSTETNSLPPLNNPNEEIQMDFIGPITKNNRRFYILPSMDRYSKWPAASFCTSTDCETAVKFLEHYNQLNSIPKTIKSDIATAFTGRLFREFCKKHNFRLIYGTPYIHTPTGLVERGVRTLKENHLTNLIAGERFGKALDMSLDVMRKTPLTRLKKSAFELHYGRKPDTEINNLRNLDEIEKLTKRSVSAKPDTLQVYFFSGAGGVSDQLPMKPKKGARGVSNYPFSFLEKKHQRNKFESAYSDKLQLAISGTRNTVATPNGRVIHRKLISKPIETFEQESNNRGTGPRGSDGRFVRSPSRQRRTMVIDSEDGSEAPLMEWANQKTPESPNTTVTKKGSLGRGRLKLIRDRNSSNSPQTSPDNNPTQGSSTGPLTITTTNITDT